MSDKIIAAVSALIGQPFERRAFQSTELRDGHTEQGVIDALPSQLADLQFEVAQSFPELEPDDIPPHLVAGKLTLNAATKGFGGRDHFITKTLPWQSLVEIGRIIERKEAVLSLYRDGLGREGEPKGVADHLKELKAGRSFYAKALDFYWSPEAVERRDKGEVA